MAKVNRVKRLTALSSDEEIQAALDEMNGSGFVLQHVAAIPTSDRQASKLWLFFEGEQRSTRIQAG